MTTGNKGHGMIQTGNRKARPQDGKMPVLDGTAVELHHYSPCMPSWRGQGNHLPLIYTAQS